MAEEEEVAGASANRKCENTKGFTKVMLRSNREVGSHKSIVVKNEEKGGEEQKVVIIKLSGSDQQLDTLTSEGSPTESGSETESQESKEEAPEEFEDEELSVANGSGTRGQVLDFMQAKARGDVDQWIKYLDETDPSHKLRSICKKGDINALKDLLASDPDLDINAVSDEGWTCLHEIITHECQFTEMARLLLEAGANVNTQDFHGDSPLHSTLLYHNSENITLLLKHGADLSLLNGMGRMPIHVVDDAESLRLLLEHQGHPSAQDRVGNTPVHYAVLAKDKERLKALIEFKADVNLANKVGSTPLHMAGDSDLAQMLLDAGANPNKVDVNANSPLHVAVRGRHKDIVKLLLDQNADNSLVNVLGKTPLNLAKDKEMKHIILGKNLSSAPSSTNSTPSSIPRCSSTKKNKKKNNDGLTITDQLIAKLIPKCTSPGILKRKRSCLDDSADNCDGEASPEKKRKPTGTRLRFSDVNDYSGVEVVEDQKRVKVMPIYSEPQFSSDDD